jgi:hypothetical protein
MESEVKREKMNLPKIDEADIKETHPIRLMEVPGRQNFVIPRRLHDSIFLSFNKSER